MKKKIVLLLVLLTVGILVLGACTGGNANKIDVGDTDGNFEYKDLAALQKEWALSTDSKYSASDVFSVADDTLIINTTKAGWGQAKQKVNLAANSYYLVEYTFTANTFSSFGEKGFDGLYISIIEDDDFNTGENSVHHRGITSTKTTGRLYFKTTSAKKTTLAINVGNEEYPVSVNSVTMSSIKLTKVSKSAIKAENAHFETFVSDHYGEASTKNIVWIVLGAVAVAMLCYAAYVAFQRNLAFGGANNSGVSTKSQGEFRGEYNGNKFMTKLRDSKWFGILLVGGVALGIRLLIDILTTCLAGAKTYITLGYNVEGMASQALFIGRYGTAFLSESLGRFCADNGYTYMAVSASPLLLYFLGFVGLISRIFESSNPYLAATFFIKFFASIADVATVILIFIMLKKHAGNTGATIISGMYSLLPITFGISSLWGFSESIVVFLVLLTFYFMLKNKYYGVIVTYFVAFLFSWTAIILAPIIIFYSVQQAINRKKDIIIPMAIALVAAFILFYLLSLPFDINQVKAGTFFAGFAKYWNVVFKNLVYTANAFNFQAILGNNFGEVSTASLVVSVIFIIFMLSLVAVGYFKYKNRMNLLLMATAFINMLFLFGNNMTPVVMALSLALMLVYAIVNKEKRVYFAFAAFAVLSFVNISIGELLYEYSSTGGAMIGYQTATIYVFSAFSILMVLYYIYIVYDIVVSKKMLKIQPMTLTYLNWWKNLFLRIKKNYYKLRIKVSKQG